MDFVKREAQNLIDEEQYKAYIESVSVVKIFSKKKYLNKNKFVDTITSFYAREL